MKRDRREKKGGAGKVIIVIIIIIIILIRIIFGVIAIDGMVEYVKVTTSMTWTDRQVVSMLDRMKCWWRTRQVRKLTGRWSTATNEFQIGLYPFSLIRRYIRSSLISTLIYECKKLILLNVCNVISLSHSFFSFETRDLFSRNYRECFYFYFLLFFFYFNGINKVATLVHSVRSSEFLRLYRIVTRGRGVSRWLYLLVLWLSTKWYDIRKLLRRCGLPGYIPSPCRIFAHCRSSGLRSTLLSPKRLTKFLYIVWNSLSKKPHFFNLKTDYYSPKPYI